MAYIYGALALVLSVLTQANGLDSKPSLDVYIHILTIILSEELLLVVVIRELYIALRASLSLGIVPAVLSQILRLAALCGCLYVSGLNVNHESLDGLNMSMNITKDYRTTSIYDADARFGISKSKIQLEEEK